MLDNFLALPLELMYRATKLHGAAIKYQNSVVILLIELEYLVYTVTSTIDHKNIETLRH